MSNPLVTTDATTTTITTYTPPEKVDSFAVWDFNVTATSSAGVCATWALRAAAKSVAGNTSLVGSVATLSSQKDSAASSWAVAVDVSGSSVRLRVTGAAATTITWVLEGPRQRTRGAWNGVAAAGSVGLWTEKT